MEERTNIDPDFDASRWQRIKRIVAEASELDLDRRRDFLTECCRDDAGLRAEAELLLESFENGDSFLETPARADAISVFEEKATRIDGNSQAFVKGADGFVAGTVLASRYRILGLLGKGGMGEVYKAEDIKLGQIVALKFLPDRLERDVSALERFHAEVRTARQVSHPNVCRVFDIGEIDGRHLLSMEFIDGDDLSSLLRRVGRLSSERAVESARELCIGGKTQDATDRRRQAQREDMPDGKNGLNLPFRAESLLSFAEYVKVNRGQDDDASDDPARAAADMDRISVAQDTRDTAS